MPKDIYSQPGAPDNVLGEKQVLDLTRRYVPHARAVTAVDETGGEARSYAVDAGIIVKTQRPHRLRPRTNMAKEVFFLNQIASVRPDLSVPRVLGYSRESPLLEYTVMTRMPGIALIRAKLDADARLAVMRELGRTLRAIHDLPQGPFVSNELMPGDRCAEDVRRRATELFEEFAARIRDEQRTWSLPLTPEQVGERALALLPAGNARVALHSNPWHEHTFVDPTTGKYIGLIDFGDAYISHPSFDLRRWRIRAERDALMEGYTSAGPADDDFMAAWLTAQVLGDMAVIVLAPALAPDAHADLAWLLGIL